MQLPDRIKVLNTHSLGEMIIIMPDTVTHVTVSHSFCYLFQNKKGRQCTYNISFRRVCATIVAVYRH